MRRLLYITFLGILISLVSCREDFSTERSSGKLEFSKSKIYLDTVFTNIGSSTYTLKVYNRSNKDINIPTVQLGKGLNSKYRLMVDGRTENGKIFNNVELLAKDSLYIFIETTVDIASANPVSLTYDDQILFDSGSNQQKVDLTTLIQDANFIFPNRTLSPTIYETISVNGFQAGTRGHTLTASELNWTNSKPYVIYGNVVVPTGSTLNIAAGTRVYFHDSSTLIVNDGATLNIAGGLNVFDLISGAITTQNEVTFEGDRLEPSFEDTPGQWGAVFILSNNNNSINHLTLKNATLGIYLVSNLNIPKLVINDSQFYGCSNFGILARNSNIVGKNVVINSAGQASLACLEGGSYDFKHCTFNNNWQSSSQRAVILSDNFMVGNTITIANLTAIFSNSIIYGSTNNYELFIDKKGSSALNTDFKNCLVKFSDSNSNLANPNLYDAIRNPTFNNLRNLNPLFKNPSKNKLSLLTGSAAIGTANFSNSNFPDILGQTRANPSDIGAYKF
jgi:hypothetical protein